MTERIYVAQSPVDGSQAEQLSPAAPVEALTESESAGGPALPGDVEAATDTSGPVGADATRSEDAQPVAEIGSGDVEIGDGSIEVATGGLADWLPSIDAQSAFDLVEKGGPVVVILLVMSLLATTVILYKFGQFLMTGVGSSRLTERALSSWIAGRPREAHDTAARGRTPSAIALAHGMRALTNGVEERLVREDVERVALEQLGGLRSSMRILEATVQIAPLLGLFGTVIGMIYAFQALQSAGSDADPAVLAGGIWVALMTTAVGLAVAIPVAFCNYWLEGRIERERNTTESALTSLFTRRASRSETAVETQNMQIAQAAE